MLGDEIGSTKGTVSSFRMLRNEGMPQVETNFEGTGELLGQKVTELATFWAQPRMDGSFYGTCNGLVVTPDAMNASYRGVGVGRMTGQGLHAWWRGALFYESFSPVFAGLSTIAVMFEYDIADDGK